MVSGTRRFSARLDAGVVDRLLQRSQLAGLSRSRLAERYIDEGLRMDDHPGIVFRDGPTGRRVGLAGGPDVWEVISMMGHGEESDDATIDLVAERLSLTPAQLRTAVRYYGEYPKEIEQRIRSVDEEADAAAVAWRRARPAPA